MSTGLDPISRQKLFDYIKKKSSDTHFIITSTNIEDCEQYCDRVLVLDKGEVKANNSVNSLIQEYSDGYLLII